MSNFRGFPPSNSCKMYIFQPNLEIFLPKHIYWLWKSQRSYFFSSFCKILSAICIWIYKIMQIQVNVQYMNLKNWIFSPARPRIKYFQMGIFVIHGVNLIKKIWVSNPNIFFYIFCFLDHRAHLYGFEKNGVLLILSLL